VTFIVLSYSGATATVFGSALYYLDAILLLILLEQTRPLFVLDNFALSNLQVSRSREQSACYVVISGTLVRILQEYLQVRSTIS